MPRSTGSGPIDDLGPVPGEDTLEWLLEESNPSVRYFTLTRLLGRPANDPEAAQARQAIMQAGPVPEILARQQPEGYRGSRDGLYTAKYGGTVWQLKVLAELGADGRDPRVREACEFILDNSQERGQGGFSMHRAAKTGGGRASEVIPCLTGNMVFSLARLGYLGDPRLQRGIDWIATCQRFDDGVAEAPTGGPYDKYEICWGKHTCHMGAGKALKALEAVPEGSRSPEVRLGCGDEGMRAALDVVSSKRDADGRWTLEASFNDRMPVPVEEKGLPSKWITLKALIMFAQYRSIREGK